jgi:hypothetical protein
MAVEHTTLIALALAVLAMLLACSLLGFAQILKRRPGGMQGAKAVHRFRWGAQGFIVNKDGQRRSFRTLGTVFTPTADHAYQVAMDTLTRATAGGERLDQKSVRTTIESRPPFVRVRQEAWWVC